jgi:cytochrome c-type biogenesis protein CcmH/NrfF
LPRRMRRYSPKLAVAFLFAIAALIAQDPATYMNSNVLRVGEKLACRCGTCRNTVATCPMLHCESSDPMRQRIARMQSQGMGDQAIIKRIVQEQGVVALASPPATGFGLFTWVMPGIALVIGFLIYSSFVRRNRKQPAPMTAADEEMIERFRPQMDNELDDSPEADAKGADVRK